MKRFQLVFLLTLMAVAQPASAQKKEVFGIANSFVLFRFDAGKGLFSITNKSDGKRCIENAAFRVNDLLSTGGYAFSGSTESISDEFGPGQKLSLEGKRDGSPSLLFDVVLYQTKPFVSFNTGIDNISATDMRVMNFSPLQGIAYQNFLFDDYHVLDGESGAKFTQVSAKDTLNSLNNLLVTFGKKGGSKQSLVMGGLSYHEFQKSAAVYKTNNALAIELKASDPVGKLVDAHSRFISSDKFYIDISTPNRFEALEKYGDALRIANHSDVSGVTIPILNFWYCYIDKFGGDDFKNNSIGTVYEMEYILNSGFLNYSPMGLRLEPDSYIVPSNQQGWWDDEHWRLFRGGQLLKPYNSIEKWGKKIRELGGVPFIYSQTGRRSEDYLLKYPGHALFNNPYSKRSKGKDGWWGNGGDSLWAYDFTDTGFIHHMHDVYANLKRGGVQGIKFDYPSTGWAYDGGFEDKYATTTSAYRNIFKLAYNGLGEGRDVQERIPPYGDVCLGVITTQRTEGDNDRVYPARITKTGLRWYKNRMVANYDHDPINPFHVYPANTADGWRAAISMTYTTSGRMEVGKYFEKMTKEMLFDLSRAVPLLAAPAKSARPVDAFSGKLYPEVYDFSINPQWHVLTFYNTKIEGETWPTSSSDYWALNKQFEPKKMLPNTIAVSLGDKTDDGGLAFDKKKMYYVFDFWNWNYVGKLAGAASLEQTLRPGEARVLAVHEAIDHPQFLSTSRHLLQGYLDMVKQPVWNGNSGTLAGTSKLVGDETYKIIVAANGYKLKGCEAQKAKCSIKPVDEEKGVYEIGLTSTENADVEWRVQFEKKINTK